MIKYITSKTNNIVKYASSLKDSKKRRSERCFLIEGRKILDIALSINIVESIFTLKELPIRYDIPQYVVNEDIIKKISSLSSPEGIVAICHYPTHDINTNSNALYLDNIQDPGNLGTIIRNAVAFSYSPIYLSSDTVDPYNEKVISASKGAILLTPVIYKKFNEINEYEKVIVSTLSDDSISLNEYKDSFHHLLVLGNEAHGVRKDILDKADIKLKIPMDNFESLNVGVASGILMFALKR